MPSIFACHSGIAVVAFAAFVHEGYQGGKESNPNPLFNYTVRV